MATSKNPVVDSAKATPCGAGELKTNRDVFDLAASYVTVTGAQNDLIQIGNIPAGNKLVPHLSRISVPALDSNGSPTGEFTIGSADDPDALIGAQQAETAVVLFGEDFAAGTSELGARAEDVPVYLKATAAIATLATSGKIVADLVIRPFDGRVDSDVT